MPPSILRTVVVLGAAAVAVTAIDALAKTFDHAPPPKIFQHEGGSYQWSVAHGLTGSLSVSGPWGGSGAKMDLVLTCSGLTSGGVQARFYAPQPNTPQLRVRTADAVFRVRSGINDVGGPKFVEGEGDLPQGYLKSLATTPTVSVEYAGQVTTFPGPGKPLAEHFGRYCAGLAQQASRDE